MAACGQKVESVLRQKDTGVGGDVARDLRGHDRLQYQVKDGLRCTLQHPGGGSDTFLIRPHNVSKSGIGLIHGSFVYAGTRCAIELAMPSGKLKWVAGVVARCNHITGKIHDLGIRFDEELNPGLYEDTDPAVRSVTPGDSGLPTFSGSCLLFTAAKSDRDLARYSMGKLHIDVTVVSKMTEALQLAAESKHHFVLATVWDEDDGQGLEFVKSLKEAKYPFPVIGLVGGDMAAVKSRAMDSGCTDVIESLTDFEQITTLMTKLLPLATSSKELGEPLVSSKWSDVPFRPMIGQYLEQLEKGQVPSLRRALARSEWKELRCICRDLRVTSAAYGYEEIAKVAGELQALCGETFDATERDKSFASLISLVGRACSASVRPV